MRALLPQRLWPFLTEAPACCCCGARQPPLQAMATATADGYSSAASQTLAAALAASPQLAARLGAQVAARGSTTPGDALASAFAQVCRRLCSGTSVARCKGC